MTYKLHGFKRCIIVEIEEVTDHTKEGIILPEDFIDRERNMVSVGRIVSMSDYSFNDLKPEDRLKEGTLVMFKKYSGILPSKKYNKNNQLRVVYDDDIYAVIEEIKDNTNE